MRTSINNRKGEQMAETREFPTAVIASISSGVLLCDFSAMHEAAEYLMGHPIWTHDFADKALNAEMKRTIAEQCPGMPTEIEGGPTWRSQLAKIEAEIGKTVTIRKGGGLTALLPTDGVPDGVEVIKVAK
jgi:hypothetical protein